MSGHKVYDVAVVGAGVFGAWTAWHLAKRGKKVVLLDAYGPANALASSGGASRIIRMGYGAGELSPQWSQRSLGQWKKLFGDAKPPLFHETGVLWLGGRDDSQLKRTASALRSNNIPFEMFDKAELEKKYPQISFEDIQTGILEASSGVLMARGAGAGGGASGGGRAVAAVVASAVGLGVEYRSAQVLKPAGSGRQETVVMSSGEKIAAGEFVF